MNQLNNKKVQLEREIENELQEIEKLQEKLKKKKEKVKELQEELEETKQQIRKVEGKQKENDKTLKNKKRKNNEEPIDKKKKRAKKFQEELSNEISEEEEIGEEIIQEELVTLFKKAYKYERAKNRKMIGYWCEYAEKFERRVKEIIADDNMKSRKTATSEVYEEIHEQMTNLSIESLWKKTEGARKANFIFAALGKSEIKKMTKL